MELHRNDLARDTVNGALVIVGNPYGVNGYEYRYVRYIDNDQKECIPVEELIPVELGPHRR